jgi:hypothetical protein
MPESLRALPTDLARAGRIVPTLSYQRAAYAVSALLVVSGAFHLLVYAVDGGPWEGPVSWRKPIVFGLSFGITLATMAWIAGLTGMRRWLGWVIIGSFAVASALEVALVTMQRWRGVPSHFNEDTAFDSTVFGIMGALVSLIVLLTVVLTVWAVVRLDAPPSLALAVRAGLVLVLVSQAVGVHMIIEGGNTFGPAGAMKLPHAVTLHAVQVLPAVALLVLTRETSERHRLRVVGLAAVGYAFMVAATMVQTYDGRAVTDVRATPALLALLGVGLLAAGVVAAFADLRLNPRGTAPPALRG